MIIMYINVLSLNNPMEIIIIIPRISLIWLVSYKNTGSLCLQLHIKFIKMSEEFENFTKVIVN